MIRHYLKIALRSLGRNPGFSAINIAGLTLGVTAVMMIGLFVWDERQYDRFLPAGDRLYRLYDESSRPEGISNVAVTPPMFATVLKQEYPQVEETLRLLQLQYKNLFEKGDKRIYEDHGILAEPNFFKVFPLALKYGTYEKAFDDPEAVVLSEELAERYFGNIDPVGKEITIDKKIHRIQAVLKNTNEKFHLNIDFILSMPYEYLRMNSWQWQQFYTYVKLRPGASSAVLQDQFTQYVRQKVHPITQPLGFTYLPVLQPLRQIHLYSANFKFDMANRGNASYVKALTITGLFILLIACFNFINLSTAGALKRAKEVGVRKSAGANRNQLLLQFMGETFLLAMTAMILSTILCACLIPSFNAFSNKDIAVSILFKPVSLLLFAGLGAGISFFAGFYPAIVLAGFEPRKVLKGNFIGSDKGKGYWLRQGLVVLQFVITSLLIISAITVYRQVNYLHNKDLGFNKDQLLFFQIQGETMERDYARFKIELSDVKGVSNISIGYGFPGDLVAGDDIIVPKEGIHKTYPATQLMVDESYIKTLGLQLVTGRDFLQNSQEDRDHAFIINESAVRELGLVNPQKAIGQTLMWKVWDASKDSLKKGQVIGVVKDFHYKSLYDPVTTAVLQLYPPAYSRVAVRIQTSDISNSLAAIKKIWLRYAPDYPMEYKFLDESFEKMYQSEDKLKTLLTVFTAIAIFVGCLGLLGLVSFAAVRKTKEIGIRKVLGASVNSIVILLSKDFIRLVLTAILIASPLAWYLMHQWLQDFAYRITISPWIFFSAATGAVLLTILTVGFHAVRAAIANPVKSLRSE